MDCVTAHPLQWGILPSLSRWASLQRIYYVPYVTLAVMTFPDMILAALTPWPGVIALLAGIVAAWFRLGLFPVAAICCVIVYLLI